MMSDKSLEELLRLGIPPTLTEVSDCPLSDDDFFSFRPQAEKCLQTIEKLCKTENKGSIKWPAIALLFAHEHSSAPYSCTRSMKIATDILSEVGPSVTKDVVSCIFDFIKPRLTRDLWKFHVGERYILISVCRRFPCPEEHLPPALNICDSHLTQNQIIGAQCLVYLSEELSHDDDRGGRAGVILDALLKLTYAKERPVLSLAYDGLEKILLLAGCCHERRSAAYLHLLKQSAMSIGIEEKRFHAAIVERFLRGLRVAASEFAQLTLELAECWADSPAMRVEAMSLLQTALLSGAVSLSWERVARILLNIAVRSDKSAAEVEAILSCRRALAVIRTTPETSEEAAVFDLLR